MPGKLAALLASLFGLGAFVAARSSRAQPQEGKDGPFTSSAAAAEQERPLPQAAQVASPWVTPPAGAPYVVWFEQATAQFDLPPGLLSRMAYQESAYNQHARGAAGEIGLMQFMPTTAKDLGIDPSDPRASIFAAARYMVQLYRRFGDWRTALAAYNWGQGNVARRGIEAAPSSTQRYVAAIAKDVGL